MAERAVAEAILLSLPPEILTEIVMLCGRSPRHPRASPAALLSSCRELYELGQAASTRADFLVAVYGTKRVIEGACARLPLLRRDVLESVFRRVGSASHPVPRYQLQRLFRKCANVSRSDLLLSILVFAEELYPPPSTKTAWTSRGRSAAYPDITLGFHVRFADDELFRDLVFAEPNASGSDEDGKRWAHLIEEGRKAGWEVKGDGPMTALLTLKFKYGMDPSNMTVAGLSRNTAALHGKELVRRGMQIHDPTEHFRSDFGIEGLSLGCSLVKEAIELEDERALRRLISLGASIVGEDDSFFWQVIRFARERPAPMTPDADDESVIVISEDRTVEESAMIQAMRGLGYDDVDFYDEHPDIRYKIADFLIEYYGVDKEVEYFGGHDALEYFAARTQGSEGFLRTMLTLLEESGWLATAVGREALINAMGICLKEDRVPLCKVFDSYASRLAEGSDRNLLVVLLRGDIDAAKELLEQEEKLTSQQITILLSSRNAPADSREFVLKFYPFDRATLEHVLSNLVGSLEKRTVAVIESLFKEQGRLLPDGAGREILLREFEAAMPTAKRVLLRPLLGPLSDSGDNPMSVLVFDLGCAIDDLDEDEVSRLLQLGAVVSCTNACTMLRNTADMEMIGTVIGSQNFTSSQLGQILRDALSGKLWSVIDYLLDENQVEPEIAYETLSNCMKLSQHEQSLDVFKKLLELAGKQRHIVSKTGMARRMAEHRGPAWLAEWNKYEARFKGKD